MPAETRRLARARKRFGASCVALAITLFLIAPTAQAADFGIVPGSFTATAQDTNGNELTQAGDHPDASTTFSINTKVDSYGKVVPAADVKDVRAELPAGFVGNPIATPRCPRDLFNTKFIIECPTNTQVGVIDLTKSTISGAEPTILPVPIYNLVTNRGQVAELGFRIARNNVVIRPEVRSGGDYGITASVLNNPGGIVLYGTKLTLWGVPASPAHDAMRAEVGNIPPSAPIPFTGPARAFLTNPTNCSGPPPVTKIEMDSWQDPTTWVHDQATSPVPTGCDKLDFDPSLNAVPTSHEADSPTGLSADLSVPQNENAVGLASAYLKRAEVTLPVGMSVNPASADGLGSCSNAQIGLTSPPGVTPITFTPEAATCPDTAKIGTVQITTPVLEEPLAGSVYLAAQGSNPFNSLLALYISVDDPQTGLVVKLPGKVSPDPVTGQLRATFDENPQLPFSSLHLELKGGNRSTLITPPACGTYTTHSSLTSWAEPNESVAADSSFQITTGPNGAPCPSATQFNPTFQAGTVSPIAGAYSPLIVNASRPDGSGPLRALNLDLPPGLVGKLAGIPYCPESAIQAASARSGEGQGTLEQAHPSCPTASLVGEGTASAGAGATPVSVNAKVYLAGPYKGAPLSLVTITPALTGPFDLGTVVVRAAANVDPVTAQIHVQSDPIPQVLHGIPLHVRSVSIDTDKPSFTLNPTNCDPMSLGGRLFSSNASQGVSSPFQVTNCAALGFKPSLALKLSGPTHRSAYPALKATLSMPNGNANIARAAVTLPKTEILEQAHIKTICTRVQYAAHNCPAQSVYGYAKAWSPLLDQPLQGPVYLRSSSHKLPDLVASLDGQIHVDLAGRIDSVNARIRNTFDLVPDAPVSRFVLTMQGGKKGLLVNNTELCKAKPVADALFDGQNGKVSDVHPVVKTDCGGKGKKQANSNRGK